MQSSDGPDMHENKPPKDDNEAAHIEGTARSGTGSPQAEVRLLQRSSSGAPPQFPRLLHTMLSRSEEDGYSDIVSWQPHGKSFIIRDREKFVRKVMPIYFKQTRFTSFQRQLNLYGFLRVEKRGPDHKSYYHERFLRDDPRLVDAIGRTQSKGASSFADWKPKPAPDFSAPPASSTRKPTAAEAQVTIPPAVASIGASLLPSEYATTPGGSAHSSTSEFWGPRPVLPQTEVTRQQMQYHQQLQDAQQPPYSQGQQHHQQPHVEPDQHNQQPELPGEDLDRKLPASTAPDDGKDDDSVETESTRKDSPSMAQFLEDVDLDSP